MSKKVASFLSHTVHGKRDADDCEGRDISIASYEMQLEQKNKLALKQKSNDEKDEPKDS